MARFSFRFRTTEKKCPRVGRRLVRPVVEALEDRNLLSLFGAPIPFAVGPGPTSPVVADFNGDGLQDLAVVTSSPSGTVSVLINNGFGGFAAPVNYSVPGIAALTAGDFNGDGRADLAVAAGSHLTLLPSHGDGTFAAPVTLTALTLNPNVGSYLAVADFFGAGTQDLAVANDGTISVLRNDGRAGFTLAGSNAEGPSSSPLAVGDFNGDGHPDLTDGTSVLLNKGDGTFAPPLALPQPVRVNSQAVGDVNGDGRADLVGLEGSGVAVLLGHGDGTFAPPVLVVAPDITGLGGAHSAVVGDFNGDGKPDIAYSSVASLGRYPPSYGVAVLLGKGDDTFQDPDGVTGSGSGPRIDVAVGDFNRDGRTDLLACTGGPSALATAPASLGKAYLPNDMVSLLLNTGAGPMSSAFLGAFDPATATWYLRGSPGPGAAEVPAFQYGEAGWLPVVGDWDGNGTVTVGVVDPATMTWYLRNENNNAGPPDVAAPSFGAPGWIPVVGDWTGSGHTGIGAFDPATGTWYLRTEDSPGAPDAGVFSFGGAGWLSVVGDWDGNGTTTVGVVDPSTMTWYLRNRNNAGAADVTPFPYGGVGWKPVAGDWASKGRTTIGVVDPTTAIWYLRNSNNAGAADVTAPFAYGQPGWVPLVGHFNGTVHTGIGMFDPDTATWYLRDEVGTGVPDRGVFQYGAPGWIPVVGDWTGSGYTGIGVVDPATMTWYLRNEASPGPADAGVFQFGAPGWIPVVGHWAVRTSQFGFFPINTGIGVVDPATMTWYLRNGDNAGPPDVVQQFGAPGWVPVANIWIGTNTSTPVVVDPGSMTWYVSGYTPPNQFPFGGVGWKPVMGDWTGDGTAVPGVIDPNGVWHLSDFVGLAPFAFGLGSWVPLVGHWLPGAGSTGSPRAAAARALPQPLDGALTALSKTPAAPTLGMATASGTEPPIAAGVPAPTGEQAMRPWSNAQSGASAVRHAYPAGRVRTAALDELFATGLE